MMEEDEGDFLFPGFFAGPPETEAGEPGGGGGAVVAEDGVLLAAANARDVARQTHDAYLVGGMDAVRSTTGSLDFPAAIAAMVVSASSGGVDASAAAEAAAYAEALGKLAKARALADAEVAAGAVPALVEVLKCAAEWDWREDNADDRASATAAGPGERSSGAGAAAVVTVKAAGALAALVCANDVARRQASEEGAIPVLVAKLRWALGRAGEDRPEDEEGRSGSAHEGGASKDESGGGRRGERMVAVVTAIAGALRNLSYLNRPGCGEIMARGGMEPLLFLLFRHRNDRRPPPDGSAWREAAFRAAGTLENLVDGPSTSATTTTTTTTTTAAAGGGTSADDAADFSGRMSSGASDEDACGACDDCGEAATQRVLSEAGAAAAMAELLVGGRVAEQQLVAKASKRRHAALFRLHERSRREGRSAQAAAKARDQSRREADAATLAAAAACRAALLTELQEKSSSTNSSVEKRLCHGAEEGEESGDGDGDGDGISGSGGGGSEATGKKRRSVAVVAGLVGELTALCGDGRWAMDAVNLAACSFTPPPPLPNCCATPAAPSSSSPTPTSPPAARWNLSPFAFLDRGALAALRRVPSPSAVTSKTRTAEGKEEAPPLLALAVPDKRRRAAVHDFLCARLPSLEASTEYDGRGAFIAVQRGSGGSG